MLSMRQKPGQYRARQVRLQSARRQRDGGYLLLAIMLMMAFMVITLAYVVGPRVIQQMKRDREEEMIRRGTQYARAVKKFYKKNGRYPSSLDDLDKGQIRFLRQRYKDPLTKDGKWKLLTYTDIQSLLSNTTGPGVSAASLASQGGTLTPGGGVVPGVPSAGGTSGFGSQQQSQQPGSITTGFATNSDQGNNQESVPTNNFGSGSGQSGDQSGGSQSGLGGNQSGLGGSQSGFGNGQSGFGSGQSGLGGNQPGAANGSQGSSPFSSPTGGQAIGGAIVGVASLSKDPTIRIYNKKKTYDQWVFIYNPMMDQANVLLRGPYQPTTIGNTNIGTPASQLNSQQNTAGQPNGFGQQNSGFGQQNSGFGQQNSGFGQQNSPQSVQPGNNYPPEQNQPQQ
jgi:hypothetical protein